MNNICVDCGEEKQLGHYDPRVPPYGEGICLCEECYGVIGYEMILESIRMVDSYVAGFYSYLSDLDKILIQNDLHIIQKRIKW